VNAKKQMGGGRRRGYSTKKNRLGKRIARFKMSKRVSKLLFNFLGTKNKEGFQGKAAVSKKAHRSSNNKGKERGGSMAKKTGCF